RASCSNGYCSYSSAVSAASPGASAPDASFVASCASSASEDASPPDAARDSADARGLAGGGSERRRSSGSISSLIVPSSTSPEAERSSSAGALPPQEASNTKRGSARYGNFTVMLSPARRARRGNHRSARTAPHP